MLRHLGLVSTSKKKEHAHEKMKKKRAKRIEVYVTRATRDRREGKEGLSPGHVSSVWLREKRDKVWDG